MTVSKSFSTRFLQVPEIGILGVYVHASQISFKPLNSDDLFIYLFIFAFNDLKFFVSICLLISIA